MIALSHRRCDPRRHARSRPAYSFARAGNLWVPKTRKIEAFGGMVSGSFASRGFNRTQSPTTWPGASSLVSWHHSMRGVTYYTTLNGTGTSPPTVTVTGTIPAGFGLQIDIPVGGARGTATFRYSVDNGTNWSTAATTAASVLLGGTGVTAVFPVGTYSTDNVWKLVVNTWADQTGNGHTFTASATTLAPVMQVTSVGGAALRFDGSNDIMLCVTGLANTLVGGADNDHEIFMLAKLNSASGTRALFFTGNNGTACRELWRTNSGPWFAFKEDDSTTQDTPLSGGTADTALHCFNFDQEGTTADFRIDNASVVSGSMNVGTMTVNTCSIGASYQAGSAGNHADISIYQVLTYSASLGATNRAAITQLLMRQVGL